MRAGVQTLPQRHVSCSPPPAPPFHVCTPALVPLRDGLRRAVLAPPMLRPLGYLSNRIREPVYQDGDVDVLRERLCLLALLIGLLTGLGYLVVIVLTRGYSIQTVVNPTWGDVEAAETLVTCPCSASDVLQYDALVPRASCRANDTAVAGAGLQKQVALVASYSASKRHLWASAVEEMVAPPVPEWEQYFLGGRDPAAVYRELEVAQRYGAFLMNCFPATFSYTTHTNLVELRDCGCRGGLCDGFLGANSLLRDPRFNCTYQREALEAFGVSNWTMSRALFNYTWALEGNQSDPRPVSLGVDPAELDLALLALEHVERLASFPAKVAADLYGVDFMPQVCGTALWSLCLAPCPRAYADAQGLRSIESSSLWPPDLETPLELGAKPPTLSHGLRTGVRGQQQPSNDPHNNRHNPRHANDAAPRTRKRHQQEHRPQRPTERSDPTQHAKGRTGDCPGPRKQQPDGMSHGGGGCMGRGGRSPPPSRAPSLCPATVPLTASASLNGICNRQ